MVNVLSNRISPPHQLLTSPLHSVPCHTTDHGSADGVNCDQHAKEGQTPVHHTDRAVPHLPHHCPQNVILTPRANSSLYSSKKVRIVHLISLFSIIRCCCSPVSLSSDDPIPPMLPTEKLVEGTNTYKKCMDDYYKSLAPKWGIFGKKFELGKYAHHQTCQQCLTMKGDIISLNQLSPSKIGTSVHIPQRPSLSGGFQYIS